MQAEDVLQKLREKIQDAEGRAVRLDAVKESTDRNDKVFESWAHKSKEDITLEVVEGKRKPEHAEVAVEWLSKAMGVMSLLSSKATADHAHVLGEIEGLKWVLTELEAPPPAPPPPPSPDVLPQKARVRPDDPNTPIGRVAAELRQRRPASAKAKVVEESESIDE